MQVIERKMQVNEKRSNGSYNCCQASINSDGKITLRNYDYSNKEADEIIILSKRETEAIFNLFNRLSEMGKNWLPF